MKRLKWSLPALLLGILGAALRRWQLQTAFEPELGLCDPTAPASLALLAFLALAAAVMTLPAVWTALSLPEGDESSTLTAWDTAFAARGDYVYLVLMVLAGFLTLAAVPFLFREAAALLAARSPDGRGSAEFPFLQLVLLVCAVPGGAGHILTARSAARMEGRGRELTAVMFPALLGCVWLLEAYRSNAADPVLWHYVPLLCAAALGMLFFLSCAGMALDVPHPRRMLWLAGMTASVSIAELGGAPALPHFLLLCAQGCAALAALWTAPTNLERMPDPSLFGVEDDGEYEDEEEAPTGEAEAGAPAEDGDAPAPRDPEAENAPAEETEPEQPAPEEAASEDEPAESAEEPPAEDTELEDTTHGQE